MKEIRLILFSASIGCVASFIVGVVISITIFFMIGAICWIVGTVIAMLLISKYYLNEIK